MADSWLRREAEPAVCEEFGQAVAVVALEFDAPVVDGATGGESFFEFGGECRDVDIVGVETLDDGHGLAVPPFVHADRDALFGPCEVAPDVEFVGQSSYRIDIVLCHVGDRCPTHKTPVARRTHLSAPAVVEPAMADFDLIVFGGGTGNTVASVAADEGLDTALVEKGPLGGTCLNRGCNPSKMLIQHANALNDVRAAEKFGIEATVEDVRFGEFVREVNDELADVAEGKESSKREEENLTLVQEEARFVDDHTIETDSGETHTGEKVVVAAGSRPMVSDAIDGLDEVDYLTSDDAIRLEAPPDRLVVLGGGYIAAELGYFFDSFGTDVALIDQNDVLVSREDRAVAAAFTDIAEGRHEVHTGHRVTGVAESGGDVVATAESESGEEIEVAGDELLVALGRRPNTDSIGLDTTGVTTTDAGFIETDEALATNVENVWAMGDVADNAMFKHSGDYEGEIMTANVARDEGRKADFTALPHAVFTEPQIGAVGETEAALDEAGREYVVGRAAFTDTAMSRALKLDRGFAKVLADPRSHEILGCHVIGHEASMLIHEVTPAVRYGLSADDLANTLIHAHPALSKVVMKACADVSED